jgi:two-component system phosphate regulon response regulator PhoB
VTARKQRILVVDDSQVVLEACRVALERAGFEVRCASTPSFSLQSAEQRPDLALVDVVLPGAVSGDALARFMRLVSEDFPVILYSDLEEEELRARAVEAGAQGYIRKAWGMTELVRRVRQYLDAGGGDDT